MTAEAFISYAHADETRRERLDKHLVTLRRDGLLGAWSDHEILAGDRFDQEISAALERSVLFIALLSPDYLASRYCYEIEFKRALEREQLGQMRIVGIVVEPCDWRNSPFRHLTVLPKDGKAVPDWTNENTAYLTVAESLRKMLSKSTTADRNAPAEPGIARAPARRVKVKQHFDAIQRGDFADEAFQIMRKYFESACAELRDASEQIRTKFEDMSKTAFTCSIVNRGRMQGGEAHITVSRNKQGRMSAGEITFVYSAYDASGTSNGWLTVEADDYNMFLRGTLGRFGIDGDKNCTPEEAAEKLWNNVMEQAGLEFEK